MIREWFDRIFSDFSQESGDRIKALVKVDSLVSKDSMNFLEDGLFFNTK